MTSSCPGWAPQRRACLPIDVSVHPLSNRRRGQVYRGTAERDFLDLIKEAVSESDLDLPPFPEVAMQLDELLRNGEPPISSLVKLVERDPALAREVWKRASSARFARAPSTLSQAIARIGSTDLWRLTMRVCLKSTSFGCRAWRRSAARRQQHRRRGRRIHKEERAPSTWPDSCMTLASSWSTAAPRGSARSPEPDLVIAGSRSAPSVCWWATTITMRPQAWASPPPPAAHRAPLRLQHLRGGEHRHPLVSDPQPAIFAADEHDRLSIPLDVNATCGRPDITP